MTFVVCADCILAEISGWFDIILSQSVFQNSIVYEMKGQEGMFSQTLVINHGCPSNQREKQLSWVTLHHEEYCEMYRTHAMVSACV